MTVRFLQRSIMIREGRYRPHWIETERHWLTCLRYIERNPVEAGIVIDPGDYPWSSYRTHAFGVRSEFLVAHPVYLSLGATPERRRAVYRALCAAPSPNSELSGV